MTPDNRQRLRTPQGTEAFFQEEAWRHRHLQRMTEDHFRSWGYLPVLTPVFDYFETYRPLLNALQEERSYRFPDRKGELLMLRSDITLFLAKQAGVAPPETEGPRRLYYSDSIIRHQEEEDISSDEFFQSGAELIGQPGQDGDLEVLMLLHDLLESMKLPTWRLHLGSRAILDAVFDGAVDSQKASALLEIRDEEGLCALFQDAGLPAPEQRSRLLLFLGTVDEFLSESSRLVEDCQPQNHRLAEAVSQLCNLATELLTCAPSERIRIDLSEHGGQPYYTGFTVRAYVDGANAAIASGGRYDNLLSSFGPGAPAAGFSMMMRKIEPLSTFAAEADDSVFGAQGKSFAERYANAQQQRLQGQRVTLDSSKDSP